MRWDPVRRPHQGQRSCVAASTGRTEDCSRPTARMSNYSCIAGAIHRLPATMLEVDANTSRSPKREPTAALRALRDLRRAIGKDAFRLSTRQYLLFVASHLVFR